jgi:hypothetical protein
MADPDVPLTTADFEQSLTYHRWIDLEGFALVDHEAIHFSEAR